MLSKGKMNILFALCLISITSVGFSAWSMGISQDPTQISGNIETDKVIGGIGQDYMTLDTNYPKVFTYGDEGFIDENSRFVKTGIINVSYTLDIDNCYKLCKDKYESLSIRINLSHNNVNFDGFDFFDTNDNQIFASTTYKNSEEIQTTLSKTSLNYSITFTLNNLFANYTVGNGETINIMVIYSYSFYDTEYFKNNIFNKIYDTTNENLISFSLTTSVEGV